MFFKTQKINGKPRIGVLTFSESAAAIPPLTNLLKIITSLSSNTYLITGKAGYDYFSNKQNMNAYGIMHESNPNILIRIFNYIFKQLQISYRLVCLSKKVDWWIFSFNADTLVLPIMVLKLLRKRVILALPSSTVKIHAYTFTHNLFFVKILTKICHQLSDDIILYSPNLMKEWGLEKFCNKISYAHEHIIDLNEFPVLTHISNRGPVIGYVGRLSEEKGIINFINAIPEILKIRSDITFLIIGDGLLLGTVQEFITVNNLNDKVSLIGWVPHDQLPDYYNIMKLLIIPSYTEGLPNTMLEAMACGTPVLANSIGSIPDIIINGKNGFILKDNSRAGIVNGVLASLASDLALISQNARTLIDTEFSYTASINKYIKVLLE